MNNQPDEHSMKLAWQAAFETRTCPDSTTLYATEIDENLRQHLAGCHLCREKRVMSKQEKDAWGELKNRFTTNIIKPGIGLAKQPGQVWMLKKEFGGWQQGNGRFIRPPAVLLLEKLPGNGAWRVAQLFWDTMLMGSGDVMLDEQFGFAESWNCYTLKEDRFDCCLGTVRQQQLETVLTESLLAHEPAPNGSVLSFFRMLEVEVGAHLAITAVTELVEEWENQEEEIVELVPGLKLAVSRAKGYLLDVTAEALDLLRNTYKPALVLRGGVTRSATKKLTDEQADLLLQNCTIVPLSIEITEDLVTIKLRQLQDNASEIQAVSLSINGTELTELERCCIEKSNIIIRYRNSNLAGNITGPIERARMSVEQGVIKLSIVSKRRDIYE